MSGALVGGVAVAAGAAACYEISYVLQALEARAGATGHTLRFTLLGRLARRPLFALAVGLAVAGYGLQVVALGLAPLTAVQPVLALGLLFFLLLGARVLDEPVGRREVGGVLVIVAAVTAVAVVAPERSVSPVDGPALVVALSGLGLLAALPFALFHGRSGGGYVLVVAAAAGDAWAALAAKLLSDELSRGRPVAALAWGAGAGLAVLVGLTCELTALQRIPATRVAPIILSMQVAVPVALAPAIAGEDWGATPLGGGVLVVALAVVTAAAAFLGASQPVSNLLSGGGGSEASDDPQDLGGGGR